MMDMRKIVGSHDLVLLTLDTLRYDVAHQLMQAGRLPNMKGLLPHGWEERHSPGNFTYAAHHAFFAGFLPTPARPGKHMRPFATRFAGSETTVPETFVFEAPDMVTGLATVGYHTLCIGGVGFFNRQTPLSRVLPDLFRESYWEPAFGVTDPGSTENQFRFAAQRLAEIPADQRVFLFINVSALHQPNYFYSNGVREDNVESHGAALCYVDRQLPILLDALRARGSCFGIICSDHGTTYGEDGYHGHRLAHNHVWTVPYGQFLLGEASP